ncbi:unnamed protein product, partial [Prorocentrum cordatum]
MEEENFLRPTAYIISGGGGGITSESEPSADGDDDQYGFMDLTLSKHEIRIEAISHGGQMRSQVCVPQRPRRGLPFEPAVHPSLCDPTTTTTSTTRTTSTSTSTTARPTSSETTTAAAEATGAASTTTSGTTTVEGSPRAHANVADPPDSEEGPNVEVRMVMGNLIFTGLTARQPLLALVEGALRSAIAAAAGHGTRAESVRLRLLPGSVVVQAAIAPPSGVAGRALREHLARGLDDLRSSAAALVSGVSGIEDVCVGKLYVEALSVLPGRSGDAPPDIVLRLLDLDRGSPSPQFWRGAVAAVAGLALALAATTAARCAVPGAGAPKPDHCGTYTVLDGSRAHCEVHAGGADRAQQDAVALAERLRGQASTAGGRDRAACWLQALTDSLRGHPDSPGVQEHGCGALQNICQGDGDAGQARRRRAVAAGGIELAAAALRGHGGGAVREQAAAALAQICASPGPEAALWRARAAGAGALELLVASLSTHPKEEGVQRQACRALGSICVGADEAGMARKEQAATAGALGAVVAALKDHRHNPEVQEQGCAALRSLCLGSSAAGVARKAQAAGLEALEALVVALRAHPLRAELQQHACAALTNICAGSDERAAERRGRAAEVGAIEAAGRPSGGWATSGAALVLPFRSLRRRRAAQRAEGSQH